MSVVWHDLECGSYTLDLALWRELADRHGDPVLEIGAGTGRVALDLARAGHSVTALEREPELIGELALRARGTDVRPVRADARHFRLPARFALCIAPMQAVQLLGGPAGRRSFLSCAHRHLTSGGILALAIASDLAPFRAAEDAVAPLPDMRELGGVLYFSQPTAIISEADAFVLVRRRECVGQQGGRWAAEDVIRLDRISAQELEHEAFQAGFALAGRRQIAGSAEYAGSSVVIFRA